MKKIIFLILFFVVLIIIPADKIQAAQYFVGIQIESASAPAPNGTNNNWCLPNGTTIEIKTDDGYTTLSSTEITKVGCTGTILWTNLVNLVEGVNYEIVIKPVENLWSGQPYCFGYNGGDFLDICWAVAQDNMNCTDTCAYYNSDATGSYEYQEPSLNCEIESFLMGEDCSSCETEATYNYYNSTTKECWSSNQWVSIQQNVSLGVGYVRVCQCTFSNTYDVIEFTFDFSI